MHRSLSAALFALVFLAPCSAAEKEFQLLVEAGRHDRSHTPVRLSLTLPAEFAGRTLSADLRDASGQRIPAQVTAPCLLSAEQQGHELNFVLPSLKAGQRETLTLKVSDTEAVRRSGGFAWQRLDEEFSDLLLLDGVPALRYIRPKLDETSKATREQTYKVFHHLYDPQGQRVVTKGPGGQYTHHRGLFFGFNKVTYGDNKKADVWHCTGDAHQSHDGELAAEAGPVLGRHRVKVGWHGQKKEVFAEEEREMTVYRVPGGRLVEFASRVRTTDGPVKLDGDPQHAGFHFRADNEVSSKTAKQTYYLRPDGKGGPGQTRNWPGSKEHVNLPWDAMSFVLGGQRYTAVYLDRPDNPKEARFSERDYGRFGSYFVYDLTKEKPLTVNYRLWLQDGETDAATISHLSADFVEPVKVTVK